MIINQNNLQYIYIYIFIYMKNSTSSELRKIEKRTEFVRKIPNRKKISN